MEISNRTLGLASATLIIMGVSMRMQSNSLEAQTNPSASIGHTGQIPDSTFPAVNQVKTLQQQPVDTKLGGTPNQDLIDLNQAGAIVPGVTRVQDDKQPIVVTPPAQTSDESANDSQSSAGTDDTSDWVNDRPIDMSGGLSDRTTFDMMLGSMNPEDQQAFRLMWSTMSPDERQQLMTSMRGG